jgi:hypothetical protein
MCRKGNCWDNGFSESFFHPLKTELTHHFNFETREEAKQAVFEYIEVFYNRKRIHSSNNYLSPDEFEKDLDKFNNWYPEKGCHIIVRFQESNRNPTVENIYLEIIV